MYLKSFGNFLLFIECDDKGTAINQLSLTVNIIYVIADSRPKLLKISDHSVNISYSFLAIRQCSWLTYNIIFFKHRKCLCRIIKFCVYVNYQTKHALTLTFTAHPCRKPLDY